MDRRQNNQYRPDRVSAPGATLRDTLDALGLTQADLASRMGRTTKHVNEIVQGKAAITADTAIELESVLGVPAQFWMTREQQYQEALARKTHVSALDRHSYWLKEFPISEMIKNGWIAGSNFTGDLVHQVLQFFGVNSIRGYRKLWADAAVALRHTRAHESDEGALRAWLRQGEVAGRAIPCKPFDRRRLLNVLEDARSMTYKEPSSIFNEELPKRCAEAGVALALIPELRKMRANGATRWLTPRKALIQLSLRYKRLDTLWFSFFHEAGHLLLHGKKLVFIEGEASGSDETEREADRFAQDVLIPPAEYRKLVRGEPLTRQVIVRFAKQIDIDAGIVLGRLRHDGLVPWNALTELVTQIDWAAE